MPYAVNIENRRSVEFAALARSLVKPCAHNAIDKCGECGSTLMSRIDVQLHQCSRWVRPHSLLVSAMRWSVRIRRAR